MHITQMSARVGRGIKNTIADDWVVAWRQTVRHLSKRKHSMPILKLAIVLLVLTIKCVNMDIG